MRELENKIFKTELLCLNDVINYSFSIPTYQRPYVWGDEQLKKIIDDFYKAFKNDKRSEYYISTLITKDNGEKGTNSELIDGQQRFTTLWLIALTISQLTQGSKIANFLKKGDNIRLSFEIRNEVYDYLSHLLEKDSAIKNKYLHKAESYPYLKNIAKALKSIEGFLKDALADNVQNKPFSEELKEFGDYIYTKVYFIKNTTPPDTDLNKLFSTINNSGVQLEQTDIVKANLLRLVDEKVLYSKIWEACENMNNFFERNARTSFPASDWNTIDFTKEFEFDKDVFKFNSTSSKDDDSTGVFIIDDYENDIIADYPFTEKSFESEKDRGESEEIYCRSVINFGQLLLHTYRLHLKVEKLDDFEGTFHVNRLIEVFKKLEGRNNPDEIKRFFRLLWKVRYLFDKYIIKWVSDINTKTETLELVNFSRNEKSYYSRTPYEKSNSLMLQSVLYFTGDYLRQYWLSSYLDYLCYNHNMLTPTCNEHLLYLENMDNTFSLTKNITDKELSWKLMLRSLNFEFDFNYEDYLYQAHGTSFKHYWFYKLEYILWKNWEQRDDTKFRNYRITSKNSVEHIYPQHPENKIEHPELETDHLDSFGNLVLLSVSQNSEYSNKSVGVKKSMFCEKSDSYDTLKSYYIFMNGEWNAKTISEHREIMIKKLLEYYG